MLSGFCDVLNSRNLGLFFSIRTICASWKYCVSSQAGSAKRANMDESAWCLPPNPNIRKGVCDVTSLVPIHQEKRVANRV